MTNEEKAELQALKEKIPGWEWHHIGRDYNGKEVSIREVKNLRRLSFLLGKEEVNKDWVNRFNQLEALLNEVNKTPRIVTLCEAQSFEKGEEAQKEKDKKAIQVKENLYSNDHEVVLKQILNALIEGPLEFCYIIILLKNLMKEIPIAAEHLMRELQSDEKFKDFFSYIKGSSEDKINESFKDFVVKNNEDDIVKLTNDLIDIAFLEISEDSEKAIVKHAVEEMA